ncbi:MAG TPA: serine/threonine-protein kinase [Kofleriaceae bacterium]|nr:serine/threonine-protein kinase [Kofleriaceae bacterium]
MSDHASSDALARFVDDSLAAEERAALEEHLDTCDDCRSTVAMLVRAAVVERRGSEPTLGTHPPEAFQPTEVSTSMPQGPRSSLPKGTKVGRYIIGDTLGLGGMGVVYAAHDPDLHRDIAIKVMRPEFSAANPDATRRIVREAQAMARVSHPNVVSVYDVGTHEGQVFIGMERISGQSLREWLTSSRTTAEILEVFIGAGHGLIAAHNAGMVHRDFKPDNVLVDAAGRARVTDFGLAFDQADGESVDTSAEGMTRPIVGTPAYMAPEQHAGTNVDPRSDQFSFAVALYEALYGSRPFAGKSRDELATSILEGKVEPPPAGTHVHASLRAILQRALSTKPGDRFASMEDLLHALARDRGRQPRRVAFGALVLFALVAVGFGADYVLRERTHAVTRGSFEAARAQVDKLFALRTDAFIAQADAMYRLPIMLEIATARDQSDFGLGDEAEDRARIARQHETLQSADWVGLVRSRHGDVLAIADHKGRLLYDSVSPELFGSSVTEIAPLAAAYSSQTETYLGVIDGADPAVVRSGLLGGVPQRKLYVVFARAKRVGAVPSSMFMQLVEAGRLLDEVGVGQGTLLSVVTAEGIAEGQVPKSVLLAVHDRGISELSVDDGTWLAERTPLRTRGQDSAIAQLVLARQTNVGLSGLFPHARQTLAALAALLIGIALAGFVLARKRDVNRRSR